MKIIDDLENGLQYDLVIVPRTLDITKACKGIRLLENQYPWMILFVILMTF